MPVIKTTISKIIRAFGGCSLVVFTLCYSQNTSALPMVPMTYSGSLGYTYSYIKADQAESETSTLTTAVSGSGFVWQPWFVTLGVGLSVGLTDSNSNLGGSGTASTVVSGNIQFTVFPQSRFPFSMTISRSDSRSENTSAAFTAQDHFVNTRIYMSQTYYGRSGYVARASYDHSKLDTGRSDSTSDTVSASFRAKKRHQRFSANAGYSTSERSNSDLKPSNASVELQHNYTPGSELGVTSSTSYTHSDSGVSGDRGVFQNVQASSVFSWRPIDRPYTLSGGARIAASDSGGGSTTRNVSTNIGTSYRLTRSLRMLAQASISATDTDAQQSVRSSESVSMNYNSQQYFVGGFNYNWNAGTSLNNSNSKVDDVTDSQQNVSVSAGHSFSRAWATGRSSTFNMGITQSGNASKSSESDQANYGVGHGLGLGWSRRGPSSATFSSLSLSDSHTFGEQETSFQQLYLQLTQRNTLSRVSAISASINFQTSKQDLADSEGTDNPKTMNASVTYRNARIFGIYALRFSTKLTYNKRFATGDVNASETTESENRFDYRVGLLTTSLTFRIMQVDTGTTTESFTFSATRSF
jgi:hypothetical protein